MTRRSTPTPSSRPRCRPPTAAGYALDARYLKRHQRMLGGLYQSVLRAELTHRFGVEWRPIVNGQAEIAGVPNELIAVFSKRSADIDVALAAKIDEFRHREGRDPSRCERAALTREARPTPGRASPVTVPPIWRHGGRPKPPRSAGPSTSSTTTSNRPPATRCRPTC